MSEQLELFQVLNNEQQKEVENWIIRENQRVIDRVASVKNGPWLKPITLN